MHTLLSTEYSRLSVRYAYFNSNERKRWSVGIGTLLFYTTLTCLAVIDGHYTGHVPLKSEIDILHTWIINHERVIGRESKGKRVRGRERERVRGRERESKGKR